MTLAQGLVLVCAALLGLLSRQDAVRAYAVRAVAHTSLLLRQRRKGRHAQAVSRPHLSWRAGNHVAFTDQPDTELEATA